MWWPISSRSAPGTREHWMETDPAGRSLAFMMITVVRCLTGRPLDARPAPRRARSALMKHTVVFVLFALALTAVAAQAPETVAWRNGAWFDRTGFRRVDVYSVGDRLTFKNYSKVDRTVDLTGKFLM